MVRDDPGPHPAAPLLIAGQRVDVAVIGHSVSATVAMRLAPAVRPPDASVVQGS